MTTLVLIRAPRDLQYAQIVRAICRHLGVPVSTETHWGHGVGDIHIDVGDAPVIEVVYAAELYLLTVGIEYRVLEDANKGRPRGTGEATCAYLVQWWESHSHPRPATEDSVSSTTRPTMDDLREASTLAVLARIPGIQSYAALAVAIEEADLELRLVAPPGRLDEYRAIAAERAKTSLDGMHVTLRQVAQEVAAGRLA